MIRLPLALQKIGPQMPAQVNLLTPCVLISLLSLCTFCLPVPEGEKCTLAISTLPADSSYLSYWDVQVTVGVLYCNTE